MNNTNKQVFKAVIIIILIALLLIPTLFITQLVQERKIRKMEITKEVNSSWASPQIISTPYVQVNYSITNASGSVSTNSHPGFIFPGKSIINGVIHPKALYRSIYKIPVYEAVLKMEGSFLKTDADQFKSVHGEINLTNSYLGLNISDAKGIVDSATITIDGKTQALSITSPSALHNFKTMAIPLALLENFGTKDMNYAISLTLKGTEKISFIPLAATNSIMVSSTWKDPSFEGKIAANDKTISDKGFTANWKINGNSLSVPRFSAHWIDTGEIITGVNLINNIDSYAKTLRSTKYALLFITLTFALFYFIELLRNTQIHPVQYVLVGLALVLFYTLLLSISEFLSFDISYCIAATATILLISAYAKAVMHSVKNGLLIGAVLLGLYSFMYIIIQLEETALLVGSIGLFILLSIVMQVSRKINWNAIRFSNTNN
jgi:inner membrane protein